MNYEAYKDLTIGDDFNFVEFISVGKNGNIPKRITFEPTLIDNVYNLNFGDIDQYLEVDDYVISNNGDRNKLLATIFDVVYRYTKKYPGRWIFFKGSTKSRTRLYRMAIGLNLEELSRVFDIYAINQFSLTPFRKNMEVNSFLIKRKII